MQVKPINNINFQAGNIKLNGLVKEDLFPNYEQIQKLADEKKIDFSIFKHNGSKYLLSSKMYTIIASKTVNNPPYTYRGIGVSIFSKTEDKETGANKIFEALKQAMENLKKRVNL